MKIEGANDILKFIFENGKKWDKLSHFTFYGGDITRSKSKKVVEEWFAMQKNLDEVNFIECGVTLEYGEAILNGFVQSIKRRSEDVQDYEIYIDESANESIFYTDKWREIVCNFLR